jgi:AbrB family looped-hinge helix DNA binding protein
MRVTSKGQVTIPIAIREKAGILPDTEVEFGLRGDTVIIRKVSASRGRRRSRGEEIVARARGTGSVNLELTTDQIMALTRGWGEDDFDR